MTNKHRFKNSVSFTPSDIITVVIINVFTATTTEKILTKFKINSKIIKFCFYPLTDNLFIFFHCFFQKIEKITLTHLSNGGGLGVQIILKILGHIRTKALKQPAKSISTKRISESGFLVKVILPAALRCSYALVFGNKFLILIFDVFDPIVKFPYPTCAKKFSQIKMYKV